MKSHFRDNRFRSGFFIVSLSLSLSHKAHRFFLEHIINRRVRQTVEVGNRLEHHLTVNNIETLLQSLVVGTRFLPALVGKSQRIAHGGVGEGCRRGVGHSTRNVCHGIMNEAVKLITRIAMGRGV